MADQRAPGLVAELPRLDHVGATLLGIVGDANHTYGYHIPSSRVDPDDYSMRGEANRPVGDFACAIDIGMDWPASRQWLRWLIQQIAAPGDMGVAEVIGSYDGQNVRYWSDSAGWSTDGRPYTGDGHDTWTHVAIYRSTARTDHRLLAGWGPTGMENEMALKDETIAFPAMPSPPAHYTMPRAAGTLKADVLIGDLFRRVCTTQWQIAEGFRMLGVDLDALMADAAADDAVLAGIVETQALHTRMLEAAGGEGGVVDVDQLAAALHSRLGPDLTADFVAALQRIRVTVTDPT